MLEILIIWRLAAGVGKVAEAKGLKKLGYQIMAILLWICGELFGIFVGEAVIGTMGSFWLKYAVALAGAIVGAMTAFGVMRIIPSQSQPGNSSTLDTQIKSSSFVLFARSNWIPTLVSIFALICLCAGSGVALIFSVRSTVQQIHASNPIVGIALDNDGHIARSVSHISSGEQIIYFGFDFEIPRGGEMPITYDWFIDGQLAYSFEKTSGQGPVIVELDRKEWGAPKFNEGDYHVVAHIGELFLTSAEFVVD